MAKTKISEFSATPANNTDIDSINIAEGCAPSGINDAIRELMAQLKDFQTGAVGDSFNGPIGTTTAAAGAFTTLSATGVTTVQAGTAALPAITTTGDTNTGIFFPAADNVAATVAGVEGMRLTSTGLGIGTSSPSARLTTSVAGNFSVAHDNYSGDGLSIVCTASNASNGGYAAGISFSDINGGVRHAGIAPVQTGSDNNQIGLAFFSKSTTSSTSDLAERMRLDSSGNLLVGSTSAVSGGGVIQVSNGITFPATQSASSNANTLDDYEEGTWTPAQGAGLTVVGTFNSNGHYVKIGRQVTIQGFVTGSTSVSVAGNAIICTGLPFQCMNVTGSSFIGGASNATLSALINVWVNQGSSTMYAVTTMAATTGIYFTATYFV